VIRGWCNSEQSTFVIPLSREDSAHSLKSLKRSQSYRTSRAKEASPQPIETNQPLPIDDAELEEEELPDRPIAPGLGSLPLLAPETSLDQAPVSPFDLKVPSPGPIFSPTPLSLVASLEEAETEAILTTSVGQQPTFANRPKMLVPGMPNRESAVDLYANPAPAILPVVDDDFIQDLEAHLGSAGFMGVTLERPDQ